MRKQRTGTWLPAVIVLVLAMPVPAFADELTQRIQKDLVALGYEPGTISGEVTTDTTVAIAKFQAEREIPVTGEVSPVLAGILAAEVDKQRSGGSSAAAQATAPPERDAAALRAAQQACLQDKMAAREDAQKKKRGVGHLMNAVSRTAGRAGNHDLHRTAGDVYAASATADDLSAAARDLGLTEDEVAACQTPD